MGKEEEEEEKEKEEEEEGRRKKEEEEEKEGRSRSFSLQRKASCGFTSGFLLQQFLFFFNLITRGAKFIASTSPLVVEKNLTLAAGETQQSISRLDSL